MQLRRFRLPRELSESLRQFLLQVIIEVILLAEEDDSSLGD